MNRRAFFAGVAALPAMPLVAKAITHSPQVVVEADSAVEFASEACRPAWLPATLPRPNWLMPGTMWLKDVGDHSELFYWDGERELLIMTFCPPIPTPQDPYPLYSPLQPPQGR